ncbi:MAG: hypothetical protein U0S50_12830 [Sphingopyxis sp.]|uniref:hypothetical protein n=1 Tax=Sphingopyxis sp. TaxID=1908224 RepID=UPI002ABB4B0A|nr:hypothetical protein [Sphingopyxis sp.]MDZ3832681.1 hypothetical protein [Sphingopyxis sp.]
MTGSPDIGGGLLIRDDGRFAYVLIAGALDERAEGRWERRGDQICLFTEPAPVPPAFTRIDPVKVDDAIPTIFASWPNGSGIAGIDFVIGFDEGDPITGYTQSDGWTMPDDDQRVPRWIEVQEPIYNVTAPRFELADSDGGRLHVRLTPNDMGIVRYDGTACLRQQGDGFVLDRNDGRIRFRRVVDTQ